jgi:hypothetical protein
MNKFEYINNYYGVNACVGRIVKVDGKQGVIAKDCGHYLGVNFDSDKPGFISHCHPTWKVEYLGMGKVRPMTKGQQRYQDYLKSEVSESFAWWIGVKETC